ICCVARSLVAEAELDDDDEEDWGVVPETTGLALVAALAAAMALSPHPLMPTPPLDPSMRPYDCPTTAAGMLVSSLTISLCALLDVWLPLFWPDEDWSRRLNCRPPLSVFRPALLRACCSCGASCFSMDSVSGFSTIRCEVTCPLRLTSMRTSMRPRSAGSSRTSKRVLPLCAEAAISTANPLKGTAAAGGCAG